MKRSLQAAKFKPLSTARDVLEEKASRRGHLQEDHYRTLATCHYDFEKIYSLNIHLEVWRTGKHGRVSHVMLRVHAGGRTAGAVIESDDWDRASFMLQKRLCSRVTEGEKRCKMIR